MATEGINLKSARLDALFKECKSCKTFADVGSDHGFLPLKMASESKANLIISSDVSSKCVEKSRANANIYGLQDKIQFIVSDGFTSYPQVSLDGVVISGMGGLMIAKILEEKPKNVKIKNFYLQPNTKVLELRQYLTSHGYKINKDFVVREGDKFYFILSVGEGGQQLSEIDLQFGVSRFNENEADFLAYLDYEESKLKNLLNPKNQGKFGSKLQLICQLRREQNERKN